MNGATCGSDRLARNGRGFTLVEILVVLAIVSLLFVLAAMRFQRVHESTAQVAQREGLRQKVIGELSEPGVPSGAVEPPGREVCRAAFRQHVEVSGMLEKAIFSEMKYVVRTPEEFAAYWHTLLDANNDSPLEFRDGTLVATDADGNEYLLPVLEDWQLAHRKYGRFPVIWEFVSTQPGEMNAAWHSIRVCYSDGDMETMAFGDGYPATPEIARLGHAFVQAL